MTQALNTALCGLVRPGDHVITTVCEHNSVLRPLYRLREQGAEVSFVEVDDTGRLRYEQFEKFLRPNTRLVVVTHASNVTGNLTDLAFVSTFAKKHGLTLVVDAAQTAGARPVNVQALGVDVLCFTGHKALLGPQGTGGLYVRPGLTMAPLVVGGSGIHSFDETHPSQMPTALEAGTLNVPGLAGLGAGVEWILSQGVEALHEKETALTRLFYEKIVHAPDVKIYGSFDETDRAPIVSLNFGDEDAARAAKTYRAVLQVAAADIEAATPLLTLRGQEMAALTVNGHPAGVSFWPPHKFLLAGLLTPGENTLTLTLTGSPANRYGKHPVPYGLER